MMMKLATILLVLGLFVMSHAATVTLSWQDNSNNEDGFRLEQAEPGQPWAVAATTPADQASAQVTIDETKLYCWRVTAFNEAGQSLPSNQLCLIGRPLMTGFTVQ
jgi:hypothetical protein